MSFFDQKFWDFFFVYICVFSSVILTTFANLLENFANIFYIMKFKGKNKKLDGIGEKRTRPEVSSSPVVVDALI